ncbi:MAG TPA: hypothetical protein VFK57_08430 [Vicinamibacterales bacterium]|nr:hypothetical protein [Vicinamibacterales bacterium]
MRSLIAGLVMAAGAAPASAQQTPADVISFLVTNQSVQTGDFQKDRAAAEATRDTIARALQVNLATSPIATSSSGFVYRLDPELGTVSRVSDSFGTFFVERAMTSGQGRVSFGASASTAAYDNLDGFNLRDGTLLTTANRFADEAAPFDTEALTLRIRTSTLTFFGGYGVTDRFEISGAVPLVQMNIDGTRLNVYRGQSFVQASGNAEASGIADIAVRAKYRLVATRSGGVAAAAEVRLPTGDEQLLLGAGSAALRLMGIASAESGAVGAHANVSIVRGGVTDEIAGSGAITIAAAPTVTVTGEVLFRRLSDVRGILAVSAAHPTSSGVTTERLAPGTATPILSSAVTGVKWNVSRTFVLSGDVLWRMGKSGLTAPFTPTISLDYLF